MARVTISGATALVTDELLGGTPHPQLKAWFDFAKGQKNVIATTQDGISALEVNSEDISMAPLLLSLSQGFTVEGAPVFIKMNTATYNGDVPEGIRNRIDPADNSVRSWAFWKDATHEHMDAADGDKIVPGNSWGEELATPELLVLLGAGYSMRLGHELGDWLPEESIQ